MYVSCVSLYPMFEKGWFWTPSLSLNSPFFSNPAPSPAPCLPSVSWYRRPHSWSTLPPG